MSRAAKVPHHRITESSSLEKASKIKPKRPHRPQAPGAASHPAVPRHPLLAEAQGAAAAAAAGPRGALPGCQLPAAPARLIPARLIPPGWRCGRGSAFCRAASSHAPRSDGWMDGWMDVHCSRSRDGMGWELADGSWERGCPPGDAGATPIAPRARKHRTDPGPGAPAGILPCARPARRDSSPGHFHPKVTWHCPARPRPSMGPGTKPQHPLAPGSSELSQQLNRGSFIGPVQGEAPSVTPGTSPSPGHTAPARPLGGAAAHSKHGGDTFKGCLHPTIKQGGPWSPALILPGTGTGPAVSRWWGHPEHRRGHPEHRQGHPEHRWGHRRGPGGGQGLGYPDQPWAAAGSSSAHAGPTSSAHADGSPGCAKSSGTQGDKAQVWGLAGTLPSGSGCRDTGTPLPQSSFFCRINLKGTEERSHQPSLPSVEDTGRRQDMPPVLEE